MNELADYSIELKIDGMKLEDQPAGVGDRKICFEMKLDPTDPIAANEVWYEHLEALFGPEVVAKLRASAKSFAESGQRR